MYTVYVGASKTCVSELVLTPIFSKER